MEIATDGVRRGSARFVVSSVKTAEPYPARVVRMRPTPGRTGTAATVLSAAVGTSHQRTRISGADELTCGSAAPDTDAGTGTHRATGATPHGRSGGWCTRCPFPATGRDPPAGRPSDHGSIAYGNGCRRSAVDLTAVRRWRPYTSPRWRTDATDPLGGGTRAVIGITLSDLLYRRRQFLIATIGAGLVFAMTLLLAGLATGFSVGDRPDGRRFPCRRWVVKAGSSGQDRLARAHGRVGRGRGWPGDSGGHVAPCPSWSSPRRPGSPGSTAAGQPRRRAGGSRSRPGSR